MAGSPTRVLKGADLKVFVNHKPFGLASDLSWQASNGRHSIYGIDQAEAFEIAEGQVSVTGSLTVYRLRADGGMEGYGLIAPGSFFTWEKYISIMLVDRLTDRVVFQADKCLVRLQSWAASSRGILVGTMSFEAISWSNDGPNGTDAKPGATPGSNLVPGITP
jgi:hypothetical protein